MKTVIGQYGEWAAGLLPQEPGSLSLQRGPREELPVRRDKARARVLECMAPPPRPTAGAPEILWQREYDGLHIEALRWVMPYGSPTEAWVLKPAGATGRLPGLVALHDHGGFKYLGKEKIAQAGPEVPALVQAHRADAYSGLAWANEAAKRGHVVLVHDAFAFGSRRVRPAEVPLILPSTVVDDADDSSHGMTAYNQWAGMHEHVMAKSLFSAGTTWPGVFFNEDRLALDVLCARDDVDPARIGVAGLSGGGLRTVFLAGLDERVTCAVCVGMMTTWRDFLLNKSHTHTWMCYVPHLPRELDYPEILGLRAPRPTLVMNTRADPLFTGPEMERAAEILDKVYAAAGVPDHFRCSWYPGHHQFNREMQAEAFDWFKRWLA